ncbi:hypothetical protein Strop_0587 [Salinispora tropica CNB-440]|uniref:Mutator family transposase n=1 Tax=Salinispora tropica (strain ATCC BAA-916 / DSM 44818 / JCM 13857 / NBRC 105044 / CNB-440) TaxID=369723 RepID=A4X2G7_SALTO|nr:hypothetical protein Strop_0587 [Salinispora tropica CNB-440]
MLTVRGLSGVRLVISDAHAGLVATIEATLPAVAEHLDAARDDVLALTGFPGEVWRQIWSTGGDHPPRRRGPGRAGRRHHPTRHRTDRLGTDRRIASDRIPRCPSPTPPART